MAGGPDDLYGPGKEDFDKQAKALEGLRKKREQLRAEENAALRQEPDEVKRAGEQKKKIRREGRSVQERELQAEVRAEQRVIAELEAMRAEAGSAAQRGQYTRAINQVKAGEAPTPASARHIDLARQRVANIDLLDEQASRRESDRKARDVSETGRAEKKKTAIVREESDHIKSLREQGRRFLAGDFYGPTKERPPGSVADLQRQMERVDRITGAGGAGGEPPRRPPVAAAGGEYGGGRRGAPQHGGPPTAEMQRYERAALRAAAADNYLAGADARVAAAQRASGAEVRTASLAMTKHGALTSEWIQAAVRGETTLRDFRSQMVTTIGKFGGWTAAAGLVYGAFNAISTVGRGALDAQASIQDLNRVVNNLDTQKAQGQLRNLSTEFNLPIDQVGEAWYRTGTIFHTQNQSLEAARAVLYSVKVGELDVADAARYLNAITQGFNLTGKDMAGVFDQINQAQNNWGISIKDTEAGMAKAAGAWRAAGGDLSSLLGLFITARQVTGRSGEELGTAFARSAGFIRRPKNQQQLRGFGIDPTQDIPDIYEQAFEVAKTLPDKQLNELGTALSSPQWAKIFVPLLREQDRYHRALADTSPEHAKGSAERELQTVLNKTSESLSEIGNAGQRLGSALAQAGFFDAFGVLLDVLRGVLSVTTNILNVFNGLPEPVRKALAYGVELLGVMTLVRRRGGFQGIGQRVPQLGFLDSPERRAHRLVETGLRTGVEQGQRYREGVVQRYDTALRDHQLAQAEAEHQRSLITAPKDTEERAVQQERYAQAAGEASRHEQEVARASRDIEASKRLQAQEQERLAKWQRVQPGGNQVYSEAERQGLVGVPGHGEGDVRPLLHPDELPRRAPYVPSTSGASVERAVRERVAGARVLATRLGLEQGHTYQALERAALGAGSGAGRATSAIARSGGALTRMGTSLKTMGTELAAGLGPLDILIGGAIAVATLAEVVEASYQEQEARTKRLARAPRSTKDLDRLAQENYKASREKPGFIENLAIGLRVPFKEPLSALGLWDDSAAPTRGEVQRKERRLRSEELERVQNIQARSRDREARGLAGPDPYTPLLSIPQVQEGLKKDQETMRKGGITRREYFKRVQRRINELKHGYEKNLGTTEEQAKANQAIQDLQNASRREQPREQTDFTRLLQQGAQENLNRLTEGITGAGTRGGATGRDLQLAGRQYEALVANVNPADPAGVKLLAAGQEAYYGVLEQTAQQEIDDGLLLARTESQRQGVFKNTIRKLRHAIRQAGPEASRGLRRQLRQAVDDRDKLIRERNDRDEVTGGAVGERQGGHETATDRKIDRDIRDANKPIKEIRAQLKRVKDGNSAKAKRLRALLRKEVQAEYDDRTQGRDTDLQLAQSRLSPKDEVGRANLARDAAAKDVRDAARTFGRGSRQWKAAQVKYNDALHQADQAEKDHANEVAQALTALWTAQAHGDPLLEARAQIRGATTALKAATTRAERIQAHADLISAKDAEKQALQGEKDALTELRKAQAADDPLKVASIELKAAEDAVRRAKRTPGKLDDIQARQRRVEARRNKRDTAVNQEIENVQYQADIGQLTNDAQVRAYEHILHTMKMGREARRDLIRRIYQLKKDIESDTDSFELNVGGIRLPTVYDVRRAIAGGVQGRYGNQMTYYNNPNINVHVSDPNAAGAVYSAIEGATSSGVKAAARNAGVA